MLPKMSGYAKSFDEAKYMSFMIEDDGFLTKRITKSGIKSIMVIKDNFIANQSTMKNI